MSIALIPDGCAVVFKDELIGTEPDGSVCEICYKKMELHDWAIMDEAGFVVVGCSFKMELPNTKQD